MREVFEVDYSSEGTGCERSPELLWGMYSGHGNCTPGGKKKLFVVTRINGHNVIEYE